MSTASWKARPPTLVKKGGLPMDSSSLAFRKEVLDYVRSCEHLFAALSMPSASPFSKEELDVLEYSVVELQKLLAMCAKR
jgi:hypothetical protein